MKTNISKVASIVSLTACFCGVFAQGTKSSAKKLTNTQSSGKKASGAVHKRTGHKSGTAPRSLKGYEQLADAAEVGLTTAEAQHYDLEAGGMVLKSELALFVGSREIVVKKELRDSRGIWIVTKEHGTIRFQNDHFWLTPAQKADFKKIHEMYPGN